MARVTVILNLWNGAATVRETLESVFAQTWGDWELVVLDDCSADEGPRIVRDFADDRLRYVRAPQQVPLGRARDLALREARGEWVGFIDQDDLWLPDKLERQMALAPDPGIGLIYGRTVAFRPDGTERDFDHRHQYRPLPEGDVFVKLFEDACFIAMSSALMRREAVLALGPIPDIFALCPDYYMFVGVCRRHRVRAVQQVICRYRLHEGSMTRTRVADMQREILALIDSWESALDPALVRRRRRVHHTVLAVEEIRSLSGIRRGLKRLLTSGSLAYLASRPLARGCRSIQRWLHDGRATSNEYANPSRRGPA